MPLVLLTLFACDPKPTAEDSGEPVELADADADGATEDVDCDDADAERAPGLEEICDGVDNDCDEVVPADETEDADGDGVVACEDCDDDDPDAFPGQVWYEDSDGDGFGNPFESLEQCDRPEGYVLLDTDCDDGDPEAFPGQVWIEDRDGDGYGDPNSTPVSQCSRPDGYVQVSLQDCDDDDPDAFPGQIWHLDSDGDGFGDASVSIEQCEQPESYVVDDTDCDDSSALVNPDAEEICDGLDNDCDDALPADEEDVDGDGYALCDGDPDDNDPEVVPSLDLEDFEDGIWPAPDWVVVASGGAVSSSSAHDGSYGVSDPGWHYMASETFGSAGEILSAWVRFGASNDGRVYLGFDGSGSGGKSFVIAPNTSEIMFQDNASWSFVETSASSQTYTANTWYYVEVEFFGAGEVEGRLYSSDAKTLLNSTSTLYSDTDLVGYLTLRSFNNVDTDTIMLAY